MYAKELEQKDDEENTGEVLNINDIQESDIVTDGAKMDARIEKVFGRKVALCLVSQNWQYKELALKNITRATEKFLTKSEVGAN